MNPLLQATEIAKVNLSEMENDRDYVAQLGSEGLVVNSGSIIKAFPEHITHIYLPLESKADPDGWIVNDDLYTNAFFKPKEYADYIGKHGDKGHNYSVYFSPPSKVGTEVSDEEMVSIIRKYNSIFEPYNLKDCINDLRSLFSNKLVVKDGRHWEVEALFEESNNGFIDRYISTHYANSTEREKVIIRNAMDVMSEFLQPSKDFAPHRKLQPQGGKRKCSKCGGVDFELNGAATGYICEQCGSSVGQDRQVLTPLRCGKCGTGDNLNKFACPTDGKTYCKNCASGQDRQKGEGE